MAEAVAIGREALQIWRAVGDRLREGDTLRWVSRFAWFAGRTDEATETAEQALAILETLPPGRELAMALSNRAQLYMLASETASAIAWGERAIALAEALDETEVLVHALNNVGNARLRAGDERGRRGARAQPGTRPRGRAGGARWARAHQSELERDPRPRPAAGRCLSGRGHRLHDRPRQRRWPALHARLARLSAAAPRRLDGGERRRGRRADHAGRDTRQPDHGPGHARPRPCPPRRPRGLGIARRGAGAGAAHRRDPTVGAGASGPRGACLAQRRQHPRRGRSAERARPGAAARLDVGNRRGPDLAAAVRRRWSDRRRPGPGGATHALSLRAQRRLVRRRRGLGSARLPLRRGAGSPGWRRGGAAPRAHDLRATGGTAGRGDCRRGGCGSVAPAPFPAGRTRAPAPTPPT